MTPNGEGSKNEGDRMGDQPTERTDERIDKSEIIAEVESKASLEIQLMEDTATN